jgi:hypothetical protein
MSFIDSLKDYAAGANLVFGNISQGEADDDLCRIFSWIRMPTQAELR